MTKNPIAVNCAMAGASLWTQFLLVSPPGEARCRTRGKKILCIEDDRETAALIAEELLDRGYDVSIAYDGREGLAAILKLMPDLVLSDISMPAMSGFELLDRLVALSPRFSKMPFVFLTALGARSRREESA